MTILPPATSTQDLSSRTIGAIVGGAVGGLLALAVIIGVVYLKSQKVRYSRPPHPEGFRVRRHSASGGCMEHRLQAREPIGARLHDDQGEELQPPDSEPTGGRLDSQDNREQNVLDSSRLHCD